MKKKNPKVFERLYGSAQTAADLPWHDPEPPVFLVKALDRRSGIGNALDLGCGAGTYSLYMAGCGYAVTAIDFMPQAVELVREQAAATGCDVDAVQADITTWSTDKRFDVILDVGCLHSLRPEQHPIYKQQLLRWLAPDGDYILSHITRRGWWDRWPLGPRRIGRADIERFLGPELTLVEYAGKPLKDLPLILGRSALAGRYWFQN